MTAYQSAPSALVGLIFPWVILLIVCSTGFIVGLRARWTRRGPARLCALIGFAAVTSASVAGLILGISPSLAGEPAVAFNAASIDCSPWREAVLWKDVEAVEPRDQKSGSGWRRVGIWLRLRRSDPAPATALRASSRAPLRQIGEYLWRADPTAWVNGAPWDGPVRYCHLDALDASPQQLINDIRAALEASGNRK